jgi:hypothetical protein
MSNKSTESTQAWEDFCEQLKAAGSILSRETTPTDDLTQAEGLRKLVRMIRMGFEATLEYGNTDYPEVFKLVTPTTLGEGETSDSHYYQTMIDGAKSYRISGDRGEAPYIEFGVYAGKIGLDEHASRVGAITEADLEVDADGRYELILSPDEHAGNWIKTTPEASVVFIRQYSHNWNKTRGATFNIKCIGVEGYRPPITLQEVKDAMQRTATYVARSVRVWANIEDQARRAPVNCIVPFPNPEDSPEMPTGHRFSSGHFRLADDEALVVTFHPAQAPYWGLDTRSYWFEPFSYGDHRSHYNNKTVQYEADGSVRVIFANQDPKLPNWIDIKGHLEGGMIFRWSRTQLPQPDIATQVVKVAELR